jgi:hypothetical protein
MRCNALFTLAGLLLSSFFVTQLQLQCKRQAEARAAHVVSHTARAYAVMNGCRFGEPCQRRQGTLGASPSTRTGYFGEESIVCRLVGALPNPLISSGVLAADVDAPELDVASALGVVAGTADTRAAVDLIRACECPIVRHLPGVVQRFLSASPTWAISEPRHVRAQGIPKSAVMRWLEDAEPDFAAKDKKAIEMYLEGDAVDQAFHDENWAVITGATSATLVAQNLHLVRRSRAHAWYEAVYDVYVGQIDLAVVSAYAVCGCDVGEFIQVRDTLVGRLRAASVALE